MLLSDQTYATERGFILTDDIKYNTNAAGYLKAQSADGSWPDINYKDQTRGSWKPSWHLYRVLLLNRAYFKTHNQAYLAAAHKALHFWIRNDFHCENWWHNNINVPFAYSSAMLQIGDKADWQEMNYLNNVVTTRIPVHNPTGQNLIWQLDNEARVALIHNDYKAFAKAIAGMQDVITISTKEGIQPDYSFHQHGPMMQVGNYGLSFVNSLLFWMSVTAHTPLAFEQPRQQIVFDYCTEGLRWLIYKKEMDIPAIGRQLRINTGLKRGENLHELFELIKSFDKTLSCKTVIDGFADKNQSTCTMAGNKGFWASDYMVQLKKDHYMMSVKMHGPFVSRLEVATNAENLKGAFINDGLTLVQSSRKEYTNIPAVWNWTMLPGTTCDTTIDPGSKAALTSGNKGTFVGQVSDGHIGACAMAYERLNIKAHKSYFMVNDMLVALGAGITSPDNKNLVTTVDQSFHSGPIVKGNGWLWHDNKGYYFIDKDEQVKTRSEYRHSDWAGINRNGTENDAPVSGLVTTTYIGHNQNDSYAYIIKPDISLKQIKAKPAPDVKILANASDLQAISTATAVIAVFYEPGSLNASGTTIASNKPCMLICEKNKGKITGVWVSNPGRKKTSIELNIGGVKQTINMADDDMAGASVSVML
ncbi:polysaccharide lyase 8 family protein [Mucilaginibacter panaciglaebae]|uniref:Polysaccharide lyase 8 family protein n=2 Tax=Mucilaginibacter panaciglaebae TaxID=502331 RepID=A0ABP7WQJ3_9SPHI